MALRLAGRPSTTLALSPHAAAALAAVPGCEVVVPVLAACSASSLTGLTPTSLEDVRIERAAVDAPPAASWSSPRTS